MATQPAHLAGVREEGISRPATPFNSARLPQSTGDQDDPAITIYRSPTITQKNPAFPPRPRGFHRTSSVSVDFFDPVGVSQLRESLSRMSDQDFHLPPPPPPRTEPTNSIDSGVTLTVGDGPFDFERSFRHFIKKYVRRLFCHVSC